MRRGLLFVVTIILIGVGAGRVGAQPVLPDPAKWNDSSFIRVFEQNAGSLLSGISRRGGLANGASPFSGVNDLLLPNPNSVHTIEASVTLLDASAVGGIAILPRAALEGTFYWNGTGSGTATDPTGHVVASIHLSFNTTTGQPEARYFVLRCNDPACNTPTTIATALIESIFFFQTCQLKISYDGVNFSFQDDGGTPVVVAAPDATRLAPTYQLKALRTAIVVPASPTASASALALFDNVAVNGVPYDDFNVKNLPRVQILPGSATFSSRQSFDLVIMVETAGEPVTNVRATVNGVDSSPLLSLAVPGTLPSGGVTYRFPNVPAAVFGVGTPVMLGVEATTASGKTARGFALWNAVAASE